MPSPPFPFLLLKKLRYSEYFSLLITTTRISKYGTYLGHTTLSQNRGKQKLRGVCVRACVRVCVCVRERERGEGEREREIVCGVSVCTHVSGYMRVCVCVCVCE